MEFSFQWTPSEEQVGTHILCFVVMDHQHAKSPPTCLVVVVTGQFEEVSEYPLGVPYKLKNVNVQLKYLLEAY